MYCIGVLDDNRDPYLTSKTIRYVTNLTAMVNQ